MAKVLNKISDIVNKVFVIFSVIFLAGVTVSCFIQVIARYVFNNSQSWTEELARYAFIWLTMCGTSIATKKGAHTAIDAITGKFTGKAKVVHKIFIFLVMMLVSGLFIYESIDLLKVTSKQFSVAMRIPMNYIYLAIPVGAGAMFIHLLSNMVNYISFGKDEDLLCKEDSEEEETLL